MRATRIVSVVAGAIASIGLAFGAAGACRAAEDSKGTQDDLKVTIRPADTIYVGQAEPFEIVLRNRKDSPITIPNWEKFSSVISISASYFEYPGFKGEPRWVYQTHRSRTHMNVPQNDRTLQPGEEVAVRTPFVPMFPGKLTLKVLIRPTTPAYLRTRTDSEQMPSTLISRAGFTTSILTVTEEMPDQMQDRYSAFRKALDNSDTPAAKKQEILAQIAAEKHYFAARFIRKAYEDLPRSPAKEAALKHLVDLARFGTAYESFPLLVKVMEQEDAPQDIRLTLLGWIGEVLARQGYQGLAQQAIHQYPAPFQEEARQAIQRLARDRNPFVAAKAREVLKHLAEAETKRKCS